MPSHTLGKTKEGGRREEDEGGGGKKSEWGGNGEGSGMQEDTRERKINSEKE